MPLLIAAVLIIWTTARHEGSHALAAVLEGATINTVRLLPGIHPELGFYFGYVSYTGDTTWLTTAAPFIADLALMLVCFPLLLRVDSRWPRFWVIILGYVSPLADLAYNYQSGFWRAGTDASKLFAGLPDIIVHLLFVGTIAVGIFLLWLGRSSELLSRFKR